ncbi:MAG: DNA primase [Myxococcota bacterium]|nr:DNA primase [Myxococcota bacterium]
MGRIPDEIIETIRDRVDIVDLIGRHVSLKHAGRNHKGLCPFHDEKTPSFVVTPDRGTFKCFGCGEGGNAFGFLMRVENLTFPEAVRQLAAEYGIAVPEARGESGETQRLYEANAVAHECYRAALRADNSPGTRYLAGRGIDAATITRFEIGYAPDRWDTVANALEAERIPVSVGERAGLLKLGRSGGHYDLLRGRVTFPIRDVRGRVVGFGGRVLDPDQEPKYLNSPESPVFQKRRSFFGFPAALEPMRREGRAVVVEGYFDLVALHRAGVDGAVATCGTALTEDHARELRRRTKKVVLLFDGDEAGQKAMERGLEVLLPAGLRIHAAVLPPGEDPDDFLARAGAEALVALIDEAPDALEVAIRRAVARGCASPADKADAVASLAPLLTRVASPVERGAWEDRLALSVGANPEDVRAAVRAQARGEDPAEAVPIAPRFEASEVRKLKQLAHSLVEHPHLGLTVEADSLLDAAGHPVVDLIRRLLDAAGSERRVEIDEISEGLSEEARAILYTLAADDHPPEEAVAMRTVADTNRWLAGRRERERQTELTERLRRGDADALEILRAKHEASRVPPERTH